MMILDIGVSQQRTKIFPTGFDGQRFGQISLTVYEPATHVRKRIHPYGRMSVSGLLHTWSINFAAPLKETAVGNKDMLLAVGNLPIWPVASAVGTNSFNSSSLIKFVEEQICQLYGNPI